MSSSVTEEAKMKKLGQTGPGFIEHLKFSIKLEIWKIIYVWGWVWTCGFSRDGAKPQRDSSCMRFCSSSSQKNNAFTGMCLETCRASEQLVGGVISGINCGNSAKPRQSYFAFSVLLYWTSISPVWMFTSAFSLLSTSKSNSEPQSQSKLLCELNAKRLQFISKIHSWKRCGQNVSPQQKIEMVVISLFGSNLKLPVWVTVLKTLSTFKDLQLLLVGGAVIRCKLTLAFLPHLLHPPH